MDSGFPVMVFPKQKNADSPNPTTLTKKKVKNLDPVPEHLHPVTKIPIMSHRL
jgi:hypothetical protein